MSIPLETAVAVLSTIVAIIAVWLSLVSTRHAQQTTIKETTDVIFKEWWSEALRELRRHFILEFISNHRIKLIGKSMKEIDRIIPEDKGRTTRLCYFFDRVGWLGAAGLIDVDYVLGPMQHVMRRTWIVMEPLILIERELRSDKIFDPVFHFGFEWLFKHSSQPRKHQANLLRHRFLRPRIRTRAEVRNLKAQIDTDEANFRRKIEDILKTDQAKETK